MTFVAALMSACAATDNLLTTVTMPADETAAGAGADVSRPDPLAVTDDQRAYLDALTAGGVKPSSEVMALSIGSYVCQAQAAQQSPQAVWDFVYPLVSSDVHDGSAAAMGPSAGDVDLATHSYIRIATERLC